MSTIIKAKAYANNEIAYIVWQLREMIPGCLGFEIVRMYPDTNEETSLASWVPFKGQSNPDWQPQNSSVWPVQKLSWRDLTLRKRRDAVSRRPDNVKVKYRITPVVAFNAALKPVNTTIAKTYTGNPVKLSYFDQGIVTNEITVTSQYGAIRATFTNGILAAQWLRHAIEKQLGAFTKDNVIKAINDATSPTRKYLTGDVLETLTMLLTKLESNPKASLKMALYELADRELIDTILKNKHKNKIEIILSNTGKNKAGDWDEENSGARADLVKAHIKKSDRMFNNTHIGHNKFVIYLENNKPLSVMTGSTNWTANGLCAQSNNAVIIDSPELAAAFNTYWENIKTDTAGFTVPDPLSLAASNVQGSVLRSANLQGNDEVTLQDGTKLNFWFSPNTMAKTVNKTKIPPDLSQVYSLMRKANRAIFFAVFLPGRANDMSGEVMTNIITEAISMGEKDHSLIVYGAISDPTAMPNYVNPKKKSTDDSEDDGSADDTPKIPTPTTYDKGKLHIVRAFNLNQSDVVGQFESELLSLGHAIVHDKIVVIDPFSENATAIFGSHNMGFKASYSNDENLIIVQNNPALVQAYAIHVLDIFEHYRFRAVQQEQENKGKTEFDGFLSKGDGWLEKAMEDDGKGDLADYMCGD